jgi:hypothetical protein
VTPLEDELRTLRSTLRALEDKQRRTGGEGYRTRAGSCFASNQQSGALTSVLAISFCMSTALINASQHLTDYFNDFRTISLLACSLAFEHFVRVDSIMQRKDRSNVVFESPF